MHWGSRLAWRLYGLGSIKIKVMGIVLALAIVLGATVIVQARYSLETQAYDQLRWQAVSLARDIAARSTDMLLVHDLYGLRELLMDTAANHPDLRYAVIYDPSGEITDSTFGRQIPAALVRISIDDQQEDVAPVLLFTGADHIYDYVVPVFGGRAGYARVGISDRRVMAGIWVTVQHMLAEIGLITVAALGAAYAVTVFLTRPLEELVQATRAVSAGDLSRRARQYAEDEVGQLAEDFNQMVDAVQTSRADLIRHNRALSVLHRVAEAGTQPLDKGGLATRIAVTVEASLGLHRVCILRIRGNPEGDRFECSSNAEVAGCAASQATWAAVMKEGRPIVQGNHCVVPLEAEGRVTGLICFHRSPGEEPDPAEADLLMALGRQVAMALENEQLWEELKAKETHRAELMGKLITAQEEERKRVALELHDQTGQLLTSMMVGLKLLEGAQTLAQVRDGIGDLRNLAGTVLEEVHSLALELRPRVLDDLGLIQALDRYTRDYTRKHGIAVDMESRGFADRRLPPYVGTTLYRIIQEALTNVARHSGARRVSLSLNWRGNRVSAVVHDDGRGFDIAEVLNRPVERLGLFGMRERAEMVGGRLDIRSAPRAGTTVHVQIPLELQAAEGNVSYAEPTATGAR